jgi:ABC-type uncharacterized transport system fused permease/ATPase subunit
VSFGVPDTARVLLANVTFTVELGQNLLISGPSGCGKTSLVRVLLGLWWDDDG